MKDPRDVSMRLVSILAGDVVNILLFIKLI